MLKEIWTKVLADKVKAGKINLGKMNKKDADKVRDKVEGEPKPIKVKKPIKVFPIGLLDNTDLEKRVEALEKALAKLAEQVYSK